ncbi:mRNA splicing protein [Saccharomycopsis crataegensis]|uniref:Pre-mRNA-splicing factor 18 n=1 Tax=Saccharomycopsis crataegensis TaxID=43959 RepID=A0AAV5QFF3_9ASCO|nr:mRNA splicing protein [Saccharomycopsis crataegensis]
MDFESFMKDAVSKKRDEFFNTAMPESNQSESEEEKDIDSVEDERSFKKRKLDDDKQVVTEAVKAENSENVSTCETKHSETKDRVELNEITEVTPAKNTNELTNNKTSSKEQNNEIESTVVNSNQSTMENKDKGCTPKETSTTDPGNSASTNYIINPEDIANDKPKVSLQLREYMKHLLLKWREAQSSIEGDQDLVIETTRNLAPLFIKLRKSTLSDSMFPTLATIMYYLQQGKFQLANETYMKLSIGNVAWPIGVISIGIHARKAQSKITGEKTVANVMIDEKTRKWITGIKRLITFGEIHPDLLL